MRTNASIPRHLQEKVNREMESGERVEWIDMPIPRFFTPAATGAFLFGIPWTAFAVFWICGACGFELPDFSKGGASFFPLFGVPFVLIGFAMLSSPLWAHRRAFKTVYVITNKRAITFDGGWTTTIRSYPPEKLTEVYRKERRDGTGDVIIDHRAWRDSEGSRQAEDLGFLRVRNPKGVEQMLKKLAEQAVVPEG
ncbi:MAG: hypothetical protein ACOX9C_10465 [Kiritimatiellia bacterium]|jgi:hypothetical protein